MLHLLCSYMLLSFSLSSALLDEWHAKFPKGTSNTTLSCEEDQLWPPISLILLLWLDCQKCAKKSRLQEVNLDVDNSFVSWWKIVHFDPQERLEYEGQPVPVSFYRIGFFVSSHIYCIDAFHATISILVFSRPMWRCWSYTARQTRLWLLWVIKSFGIQHFPLRITQKGIFWSDKCTSHPADCVCAHCRSNSCVPAGPPSAKNMRWRLTPS